MSATGRLVVGLDLGGTKMYAGLLDSDFKVLAREKMKTRGKEGDEDTFTRMVCLVRKLLEAGGVKPKDVAGIGIGSPGPLNPWTGVIGETANLDLRNFPMRERMQEEFGVPAAVDNDVNMGTYGEFCFGAARDGKDVLGVFPGTGIGGGFIVGGKVYQGASGSAAEFGHIVLDPQGPRCGCGRRGCLEAFASRQAIAAQALLLVSRGEAPALAEEIGGDIRKARSGALARSIKAGDTLVEDVVRHAARRIGFVIGNLINVASPDTVVLGGGMVEAMPKLFLDETRKSARDVAMEALFEYVRFVTAALGDDATMMGAARMISDQLDAKT